MGIEDDTILISFDWDSQPVATYSEARAGAAIDPIGRYPNGGSGPVLPVPRSIWQRYADAEKALWEATEQLETARDQAKAQHGR